MKKNTMYPGKRIGRLVVVEYLGGYEEKYPSRIYSGAITSASRNVWLCKCDCGNYKAIREDSLKSQLSQSCGCRNHRENKGKANEWYLKNFDSSIV